jgi:hypothetical protein
MTSKHLLTSLAALLLLSATTSFAQQDAGPGGQGQGGPPPDFNPQAMRQRMMDRMRDRLGATDEEWKVLSPKIEKVMTTQRDLRGGGGPGGPGGPGGGGFGGGPPPQGQGGPRGDGGGGDRGPRQARGDGGGSDRPGARSSPPQEGGGPPPQDPSQQPPQQPSPVAQARQNLREAVDDSNTRADELARLVKSYREARDQAKDNLTKAQKELKELVTPKQEAFFVSMGLLD